MSSGAWELSAQDLTVLELLEFLADEGADGPSDLNGFAEGRRDAAPVVRAAKQMGYVETYPSTRRLGDTFDPPMLTASGRARVDEIRGLRTSRRARSEACRNAVIRALYEAGTPGPPGSDHFFDSGDAPTFYGTPFTQDEVHGAFAHLREHGLVDGIATWGPVPARPRLTSLGLRCAEDADSDVRAFLSDGPRQESGSTPVAPMSTQNNYFYGTVAQAAFGNQSQQTLNQGTTPDDLRQVFAAMRDALAELPRSDEMEDLGIVLQDLESDATSPDRDVAAVRRRVGMARRMAAKAIESGAISVGTDGGQRLLGLLAHLAQHLS